MTASLTTTSYALLGLLALKPWTTYELTLQMDRSLSRFWPRATSKLYEEPKKLVAAGFAAARVEPVGRRRRTVYHATEEGRQALKSWLRSPGAPPSLEFEGLVKLFFAEYASKEDVLGNIASLRQWAQAEVESNAAFARAYRENLGPFPERAAQITLVGRYLADLADLTRAWAQWAEEEVRHWPTEGVPQPDLHALQSVIDRAPLGQSTIAE